VAPRKRFPVVQKIRGWHSETILHVPQIVEVGTHEKSSLLSRRIGGTDKEQPPFPPEISRVSLKKRPAILQIFRVKQPRNGLPLLQKIRGWLPNNGLPVLQTIREWHPENCICLTKISRVAPRKTSICTPEEARVSFK
jgi:hypothetical protein